MSSRRTVGNVKHWRCGDTLPPWSSSRAPSKRTTRSVFPGMYAPGTIAYRHPITIARLAIDWRQDSDSDSYYSATRTRLPLKSIAPQCISHVSHRVFLRDKSIERPHRLPQYVVMPGKALKLARRS